MSGFLLSKRPPSRTLEGAGYNLSPSQKLTRSATGGSGTSNFITFYTSNPRCIVVVHHASQTFSIADVFHLYRFSNKMYTTCPEDVDCIVHDIRSLVENKKLFVPVTGVLFPNGCQQPVLVPVPLDSEMQQFLSIDDLYIKPYIPRQDPTGVYALELQRKYIDCFPLNANSLLENHYTIFYCDQSGPFAENSCVSSSTMPNTEYIMPWTGNILLIKHGNISTTKPISVIDITAEDLVFIQQMVEW
ncbi:hypothetical protein EV361DRAFT_948382 [Lentinula raphanica]|nr:hypothetical protein F5880DRAFT_1609390 [Lentinula raphanica]KAJ3972880.1 hypothetical protein EV361DRAFT_948382 [Lentinula raphanica]